MATRAMAEPGVVHRHDAPDTLDTPDTLDASDTREVLEVPNPLEVLDRPAVVVLVGAAGSGKTTLRRALVAAGYDAGRVVSLDDLRRCERAADAAAGRPVRPLQAYSLRAVRRARRRCDALAGFGAGYLADATHLRRRERVEHVRAAEACGLPSVAVLLPHVDLATLVERDALRPVDERVPADVLARHAHRRSLLSPERVATEGFTTVVGT